ncbi:ribosomal protection-like ABC-F family protein [Massilioclostridium coli]|uniref:ribosomal protection-like ABC-F family protein n=1 Tax=Massilioclostridium coli TaxID=1870991 RepID=UPI0022DEE09F|nr:ABC-F type ribosomal protection protein [Massilioclostridium coli]
MSLISIQNLTFSYDGNDQTIFDHVSFQFDTHWKLGFIGRNGRGKTTFLRLLQKEFSYTGTISCAVPLYYFPMRIPDQDEMVVDLLSIFNPNCDLWMFQREFSLLKLDESVLYRPYSTLSNGEQTKIQLASLFLQENSFLLIDEPTNHLDWHGRQTVARYLNQKKQGFLLVSHDRTFLDQCVDHILSINRNNIEVQQGNCSSWLENKQRQDQFEQAENEKLQKEICRLQKSAQQTANWSDKLEKTKIGTRISGLKPDRGYIGHKSAKMMQRSKSIQQRRQKAVEQKSSLLKNIETTATLKLSPLTWHTNTVASCSNLSIAYDDISVCQDVAFTIQRGDRIALCGKNGCGKSSILKLFQGYSIPYQGEISIHPNLQISYLPQDCSQLNGDLKEFIQQHNLEESLFKAILRKLDFSRSLFDLPMEGYSNGQKKKIYLAASLCKPAHLYLWDEPLNYIDLYSRIQIEELLLQYQPTLLFVEHDQSFLEHVATKQVVLSSSCPIHKNIV